MKRDVYQIITDRIIGLLKLGTVPWHRPWRGSLATPQNLVSRKAYRGINVFLLNAAGFASPFWLTFKQVQELNGRIKKGEKSFPVVFWKVFEEEENGEIKKVPFLRYHSVVNVAQCEGIGVPQLPEASGEFHPLQTCEQIVTSMLQCPVIKHGGVKASYCPTEDKINIPEGKFFESVEAYYCTLFHELTHSTGHISRLNRKEIADAIRFGSDPYNREELVAEMGSAFLCGHCGIENTILDQSASYIQSWLSKLSDDRKLVIRAAAQAQKACDFILGVKSEEEGCTQYQPKEFKVVALRECPVPDQMQVCDTPCQAAAYWRLHVATNPHFNVECECFAVLLLNTRRRVKGHQLVTIGTLDTVLVHAREVFRTAIVGSASAVVLMHNHPSGDPTPSEADVAVTHDLIRAGKILKIDVLDHVIMGNPKRTSLRELGYFR